MGDINIAPYKPAAGTLADANQIANAFQLLQDTINDLDNNNLAAGKVLPIDKLMQGGGVDGDSIAWDNAAALWKVTSVKAQKLASLAQDGAALGNALVWDGAKWAPGGAGGTIYRKNTIKDIANTITETDLLNGEVTIGAGVLGTNKTVRATLIGDALNNSGASPAPRFRVKFGGVTIFDEDMADTLGISATRRPWRIQFDITNLASAAIQFMEGFIAYGEAGTVTTGIGALDSLNVPAGASASGITLHIGADATVNTALAALLEVTVQWAAASASTSWRLKSALVEVV